MTMLLVACRTSAQSCPGDCTGDRAVGVSELIRCVNIALGNASAEPCAACDANGNGTVMVDDLIASVNAALSGCSVVITASGMCLRPGPQGLEPCAAGTAVRVLRCDDPQHCLTDPGALTVLDLGAVAAGGAFSLRLDSRAAAGMALVFEADVEPVTATTYRVIDIGPAGTGRAADALGSAAGLASVIIDPISEAATRLLDANGLENFSADGVAAVSDAVRTANVDTSFAGIGAAAGADAATATASFDPVVQLTLEQLAMTPTPTRTASPTPTPPPTDIDVTSEGAVQASSVFGGDQFPAALAVDDDRRTAWFSDGAAGGETETYRWTGTRDDRIASIAILSNAQHATPQFRSFGFGSVRIQVLDIAGVPVFDAVRDLPGATDPDIDVAPVVVGHSVLLTFTGHDDPSCGGFSELHIVARR
jgi:hypothetical protein